MYHTKNAFQAQVTSIHYCSQDAYPQKLALDLPFMLNFSSKIEAEGSTSKPGLVMPGFSHRCCVSMVRTAEAASKHEASKTFKMETERRGRWGHKHQGSKRAGVIADYALSLMAHVRET